MTPEERLARIEGILEQNAIQTRDNSQQIKALVDTHMSLAVTLDRVVDGQARLEASQRKTDEMLQAFIRSLHKGGNGSQ
jgi:hypothetical protein